MPFSLTVSGAVTGSKGTSRTCRCPLVEDRTWDIYGVDEAQALYLSIRFLREMVAHKGLTLVDADGNSVEIPYPPETASHWPEPDPDHV